MSPPVSRRKFFSDYDHAHYLYGKALHWIGRDQRRARLFAQRIPPLLAAVRGVFKSIPGCEMASLAAELDSDWNVATRYRRKAISLIELIRGLAPAEAPIARRAILRDYSPAKLASAYDLLARCYRHRRKLMESSALLERSREICAAHRIPFKGAHLVKEIEEARQSDRASVGRAWLQRLVEIAGAHGARFVREDAVRGAIARGELS